MDLESVLTDVNQSSNQASDQTEEIINNDLHFEVKEVFELTGNWTNRR